jgi:hypothetical protein
LGIGDWGLGPIPNPQSPIPNPQSPKKILKNNLIVFYLIKSILFKFQIIIKNNKNKNI